MTARQLQTGMHPSADSIFPSQNQTMKIAIDSTIVKQPMSGVQYAASAEAASLRAAMPETTFLQCGFYEGCENIPASIFANAPARVLWQQITLPNLLRAFQADVLFSTAYTCPLFTSVPTVLHVHDTIALEHPEMCSYANVLHMRTLMPSSIRHASLIIASSNYVARRIRGLFPDVSEKLCIIPLGVDFERFSTPSAPLDFLPDKYLLYLGNIEPKKGLPTLLKAYGKVAEATNIPLVIGGRVAWKANDIANAIANWSGPGKIIRTGRISDDKLPSLYQHATAFIFPSLEEGFGLPVLEAMAAGTPVVHSSHPALLETAGNAGIVFNTGNADDLAEKIIALLSSDSMANSLKDAGIARAHSMSWKYFGIKLASEIQNMLELRKAQRN